MSTLATLGQYTAAVCLFSVAIGCLASAERIRFRAGYLVLAASAALEAATIADPVGAWGALADGVMVVAAVVLWVALATSARRAVSVALVTMTSVAVAVAGVGSGIAIGYVISHGDGIVDGQALTARALQATFVVVALAGSLGIAAAAAVGRRTGTGLHRLTEVAQQIQAGDLRPEGLPQREDELGQLGRALESMASSIRFMTGDLRVSAEREARLRSRLGAVIAGMVEGLVVSDRDGRVTECNRAAAELLGVDADAVVGRPIDEVVWFTPTDRDGPVPLELPASGTLVVHGSVDGPDGIDVPVIVTGGVLRDPHGHQVGSVLVLRDQRREQEIERMKTDFLSNIGHELRSPLTPIKGYAGVLQRRAVEPAQAAAFAREINAGVEQLERVIGRLVNFATAAAGRLEMRREPVRARDLVDDAVERWRSRLGDGWTIDTAVEDGDTDVVVDRVYVQQALDELVDNAVKYSPDASRILIGCGLRRPQGGRRARLRVYVLDFGVGIDPSMLEDLTAEFAQGDTSATRRFGGLGLGLALVARIVRAHDGRLACESTAGHGSRFSILLPVDVDALDPAPPITGAMTRP